MHKILLTAIATFAFLLAGCDSASDNGGEVRVNFELAAASAAKLGKTAAGELSISGTNGTLTLTDVRLIVAEFELERQEHDLACESTVDDDGCEKFESPPFFLPLPLETTTVTVARGTIPPDTYDKLEFEIEDLEDDPEDDDFAAVQALLTTIRGEFADWPDKASMLLVGQFDPGDSPVRDFRVYAEAEIEIELDLNPPLVIDSEGADYDVTIRVDPTLWLMNTDGTVRDLSSFDYDLTGNLLEFEVEIQNGFKEVEVQD